MPTPSFGNLPADADTSRRRLVRRPEQRLGRRPERRLGCGAPLERGARRAREGTPTPGRARGTHQHGSWSCVGLRLGKCWTVSKKNVSLSWTPSSRPSASPSQVARRSTATAAARAVLRPKAPCERAAAIISHTPASIGTTFWRGPRKKTPGRRPAASSWKLVGRSAARGARVPGLVPMRVLTCAHTLVRAQVPPRETTRLWKDAAWGRQGSSL